MRQFKTSLRHRSGGSSRAARSSSIRPGAPASENDPSIPYRVEAERLSQFDDIVAAIGQSGIGSLDVISTFPFVKYPRLERPAG